MAILATLKQKFQWRWLVFALVILGGSVVRLSYANNPPLDFHAVRQLRSMIIARGVYYDLNTAADPLLRQKAHDLAIQDAHEPPINEWIVGVAYFISGGESIAVARVVSTFYWVIGGLALFALSRRYASFWASLVGLAFYFCLPFGVYASRSFQPDPFMAMWILLTAWAAAHWKDALNWRWGLATAFFGAMAILVKVMAGLFIAPLMIAVVLSTSSVKKALRNWKIWALAAAILIPGVLYYIFGNLGRSEEYFSFWTLDFLHMLVDHKFYAQWLGMINYIAGLTMFCIALFGVLIADKRYKFMLIGMWAGYILFGLFWPFQYTTHDYYHLMLVPLIGLSIPPVFDAVFTILRQQAWIWRAAAVGILVFAAGYQLYVARSELSVNDYSFEPESWRRVGASVPAGSSVVALTGDYGLRMQYYGWRKPNMDWPTTADLTVQKLRGLAPLDYENVFRDIIKGEDYFLVTAFSEFDKQPELKTLLENKFAVYYKGGGYIIYDLKKPLTVK